MPPWRQVADVLVVQVQVNKSAQLALGREQVFAQVAVSLGEGFQSLCNGGRFDFDAILATRVDPQWSRM